MKKTKKILALVMAIVMLSSLFVFSVQAISYSPSFTEGEIGITLQADKTTVKPGDEVTFSFLIDAGSYNDFGPWAATIVYNDAQISPKATVNTEFREYTNACANFMKQTSTVNFNFPMAQLTAFSAEDKEYYTKGIMMNGVVDTAQTSNKAGNGWTPEDANTAMCTFTMKVADNVAPGTEIWIGNHEATYIKGVSYMSPAGSSRYANTVYDLTNTMVKLTVESSEATPVVAKAKSQVLFTGDKATGIPDDAFAYRLTSVVTADDLALMNTNGKSITELGFVAANASNAGTLAEAKAAVEAGTQLPAGWKTANTTYISQADATADAYFGARIQNILHSTQAEDISVCAYVAYTDGLTTSYIWYDAAVTAGVSTNYDSAVAAWAKL